MILVIGAAQTSASRQGADPNDARQVAQGRQVYAEKCASCHGANLEGQPGWKQELPEGGRTAPPHDQTGHTWHHPDAYLFEATKYGGQSVSPPDYKNNMPAFGETLSDQQIWAVLAYIKSRWPPEIQQAQREANERMKQ